MDDWLRADSWAIVWVKCDRCGEIVGIHQTDMVDGKQICLRCQALEVA